MKRRWIVLLLTILFLWAVVSRFTELKQLQHTLQQGQWEWILAAFLSQIIYFIVFTASYQAAFETVDIQTRTRDLIPVTLGAVFVNMVVPAGVTGGTALFAQELGRRGKPATRTATGVLLQLIANYSAFAFILVPGIIYLLVVHDLQTYEILAAILLLLMITGMGIILLVGIWRPAWLHLILDFAQRTANRVSILLRRPPFLTDEWARKNTEEFNLAALATASHPARLIRTGIVAFFAHLLDITTLYILFQAFHQPVGPGTLVAGYAMGMLFWIISITPQGIGLVEGVMTLTFTSLGIPGAVAATVVLAFRGLTFWIPMLLGLFGCPENANLWS